MKMRITPVNDKASQEGSWTKYRGVDLKVARANNERFQRHFMNASRPHRRDIDKNALDNATAERILCGAIAEGILLDWDNFIIDGEVVEYSKENAFELMKQDSDCRDYVQEFSRDLNNYIEEDKTGLISKS